MNMQYSMLPIFYVKKKLYLITPYARNNSQA